MTCALVNDVSAAYPDVTGVHRGVPAEWYHRWEAASNSRLMKLRRSPAHLKAALEEPAEDTDALRLGRAIHSAILEPDEFSARYGAAPMGLDRRTKDGKESWAALQMQYGAHLLKYDEMLMCLRIRDRVHTKHAARGLLVGPGEIELSVTWRDADTDLACKARWDRYASAVNTIVDLKSTRDASRREFERSIFANGYHCQAAFYLDAAHAIGVDVEHYCIVAVEKAPPYEVGVYRLTEGAIDAGREQLAPLKRRYAECLAANYWPGYPDEVTDIALPDWAWRAIDDEVEA